ncbi:MULTISPECIES: nuclear transport factor 2 family protein [Streptomyces]|uniref:Ketosteroid isomerase n=1 Tax=Streptomyces venezuelae TaxID=54571 RepID=A0A5P2AJL1_STRVZ|nr:nuclear transport factor 2 family protein [Streptomyces venezuelae]QES18324.1 ketosteroid isomerase [Streptomyces venezuelae]
MRTDDSTATATTTATSASSAEADVRRYYELVDAGDVPGLVGLFTSDATYHRPGYEPFEGHEGLTRFYGGDRVIRTGRHTLTKVLVEGSDIAVHGEFNGELHDGTTVGLRFADFFQLTADGRFGRRDTFFFAPLV